MGVIVKNKVAYGGGENIEIDTALSTESTNPVQNKVVTEAINEAIDDINVEIDKLSDITDVSDLITVRDSDTTTVVANLVHKYGNHVKGSIAFSYTGSTLRNVLLFDVDESISPVNDSVMIAFNQNSGNTYGFAINKEINGVQNVIRSITVAANNSYVANETVYVYLDWYTA